MTAAGITEEAFRQRMQVDGDLSLHLCEHLWNNWNPLLLGGHEFEVVGCDEVPGYDEDDMAVLLRRKSDGQVFEADIEVTVRPVPTAEERKQMAIRAAELAGQMRLPGVTR